MYKLIQLNKEEIDKLYAKFNAGLEKMEDAVYELYKALMDKEGAPI